MKKKENILEKSKKDFRLKVKTKLVEKIKNISGAGSGEALYLRPFRDDDQMIEEIAGILHEKKSAVAQKLLHLVLNHAPNDSIRENRQTELLEWLVENEKHQSGMRDRQAVQIERLEAHAREMEAVLQRTDENSHFTKIFVSEIYCLSNVCVTLLNQIFTRLIEYLSPVELEKKNSTDFANRNILGLVTHSLSELEKIADHHHLNDETIEPELLYLFTKIEILKARLLPGNSIAQAEQK